MEEKMGFLIPACMLAIVVGGALLMMRKS